MDKILHDLYHGKIYPEEQFNPIIEEYKILKKGRYKHYDDFIKKIGSPLAEEFEHIMDEELDAFPLELSEMFIDGFRLGARMMIEIFEDKYKTEE